MKQPLVSATATEWFDHITVLSQLAEVWRSIGTIHLVKIGGTQLTLDNVLIGVVMLVLSFKTAHLITRLFEKRLVQRLSEDLNLQATYRRVLFYVMAALCIMLSLSVAGIPLTIFTVLGGALAIGVGFGSQNVMNNFISGLIIMLEKPLRVGDTVEIDGVIGSVMSIGARSTHLKTVDEKTHVIPNSFFLEKSFLNWSLDNSCVRNEIGVNVAYGVDTLQVQQLIQQVLLQHPKVLETPEPSVQFSNFGDSALEFSAFFWLDLRSSAPPQLRSELRFAIDAAFREHQIDIPFPQRTLNFAQGTAIPVVIRTP